MSRIYYRNKGGIGNQLFIYSFAKSISVQYNKKIFVDNITGFSKDFYKRKPILNSVVEDELFEANLFIRILFKLYRFIPNSLINFFRIYLITEESSNKYFKVDSEKLSKSNLILIDGYFQSYKYFSDFKELILANSFNNFNVSNDYLKFANSITKTNSVSIHVRRCQYDNLLEIEFYFKAIEFIKTFVTSPIFFVFTDDKIWCKKHFHHDNFIIVDINTPDDVQELYLMSICNHNIIANSSFSWWGAFLKKSISNKHIVAPKQTQIGVTNSFYPKNWHLI